MVRMLQILVLTFGISCVGISLTHIFFGAGSIPGSVPVNATMDSEDRFYATLFLGFGVALAWCTHDLAGRANVFKALLAIFFAGGLARLISIAQVGLPIPFFELMTAVELLFPLLLWWMHKRCFPSVAK